MGDWQGLREESSLIPVKLATASKNQPESDSLVSLLNGYLAH